MDDCGLDALNDEQRLAVEATEGFVRVVAGAGSGKTRALAHRFAYLVKRLGVLPGHILCVTFSNKSANEMRARIRGLVGDIGSGLVNTFHGFCAGVIREDGHCVGYPQNFPVLDNPDIDAILRTIYEERGLTMRDCTFSDARDMFEVRKTIKEREYCREMVELPLETLRARYRDASTVGEILFRGYVYYEKKCFALDYNDLILLTLQIFRDHPDVRRKWRERLEYVMIDEFQDVDPLQYELMETLVAHHRNLFVVGDPDQTIYSWRGADVKYLLDFDKRFPGVKTIVMNRNYRSTNEVLSVANSLIAKNAMRIEKNLVSMRGEGPRVLCRHAKNPADEAEWIARKMRELHKEGVPYSAMAVIYRAHFVTRELETQLKKAEVPYAIYSGVAFYDRAEIKDALSYLRLVYSRDDLSFARAANVPRRNIGTRRMSFLRARAEEEGKTLYETLKSSLDAEIFRGTKARELVDLVERHQNSSERPSELLSALLDESGYEAMLRTEGSQTRLDNVSELKNGIVQYEAARGEECSVGEYLAHVALFTNRDADSGKSDRVKLMTVHTAKGLEFPHVFLCALDEGVLPSRKTESKEQMEEERRLAFVAVTRAERGLYLTSSGGCGFDGTPKFPSRFFLDIDPRAVDYVEPPREDLVASLRKKLAGESAPRAAPTAFAVGARVRHEVFGEGTVVATDAKDPICQVRFDRLATTRWLATAALRAVRAGDGDLV